MYQEKPMTDRVKAIREKVRTAKPQINISRYRLLTEWYMNNPRVTGILRRAASYKYICENLDISIFDHEMFVGAHTPFYRGAAMYPETSANWIKAEVVSGSIRTRDIDPYIIDEADRQYVEDTIDYWMENCNSSQTAAYTPEGYKECWGNGVSVYGPAPCESPTGHFIPGHRRVLNTGLQAIRDQAKGYMDQFEKEGIGERVEQYNFYRAVVLVCEGVIDLSQRYSDLAKEQAAACTDPQRKAELELIAETTARVPRYPARDYYEALQCVFFYQTMCSFDAQLHGISLGRIDQYFQPYYEKGIADGTLTEEKAQELMDLWYLKFAEQNKPWGYGATRTGPGYGSGQLATVGGVNKDGTDATCDMTFICLRTTERLVITQPCVALRVHDGMSPEIWEQVYHTIGKVSGLPSFENDKVIIPALMARGFSLEDARDYSAIGCVEPGGTGTEWPQCGSSGTETYMNLAACMFHAVNNGLNTFQFPGAPEPTQTGLSTGYLYEMENIEQVMEAYEKQLEFFVNWQIDMTSTYQYVVRWNLPVPIASAAIEGCMESGRDVTNMGAKYTNVGVSSIGTGNIADSLTAIQYLCFDTKRYTTREFYDAMMSNWSTEKGQEIHAAIVNDCPHFGNGDEYADRFGKFAFHAFAKAVNGKKSLNGVYHAGTYPVTANVVFGSMTPATPDGRYKGDPLADGISGVQSRDTNGPLAVLKSISNYNCYEYSNGTLLNMKFGHNVITNEQTQTKVRDLIETYFFDYDGMEIQLNFVGSDTMKAAQADPETYKDLVVRIAGFSAFFVEQAPECQNDLIKRTEQEMS